MRSTPRVDRLFKSCALEYLQPRWRRPFLPLGPLPSRQVAANPHRCTHLQRRVKSYSPAHVRSSRAVRTHAPRPGSPSRPNRLCPQLPDIGPEGVSVDCVEDSYMLQTRRTAHHNVTHRNGHTLAGSTASPTHAKPHHHIGPRASPSARSPCPSPCRPAARTWSPASRGPNAAPLSATSSASPHRQP